MDFITGYNKIDPSNIKIQYIKLEGIFFYRKKSKF